MRSFRRLLLLLPLVILLAAVPVNAVNNGIYLRLIGATQGLIQGEDVSTHHANWISTFSYNVGIETPIGSNGLPSGPARTTPLFMTKIFDRSSVKIASAAATQEEFTTWTLEFVNVGVSNSPYYRITLAGARVSSFQQAGAAGGDITESVGFSYTSITLNDITRGVTVSYPWNSSGQTATVAPSDLMRGVLLPPIPNPTRGQTQFRFSLPVGVESELELFDLQGRHIRQLHRGRMVGSPAVTTWDGTDDNGAKVPEGIYLARLKHEGAVLTQRFSVIR